MVTSTPPPAASRMRSVRSPSPSSATTASAPRSRSALQRVAAARGRDDAPGAEQLRRLHRHAADLAGGAEHEHGLARLEVRAPGRREPAREAGVGRAPPRSRRRVRRGRRTACPRWRGCAPPSSRAARPPRTARGGRPRAGRRRRRRPPTAAAARGRSSRSPSAGRGGGARRRATSTSTTSSPASGSRASSYRGASLYSCRTAAYTAGQSIPSRRPPAPARAGRTSGSSRCRSWAARP